MKDKKYNELHNLDKTLKKRIITCARKGEQVKLDGYAIFKKSKKFSVIQNRQGHKFSLLSYVLMYKSSVLIRVDIIGRAHKGIPTPHVHICNEKYDNGCLAIPLSKLKKYKENDDIVDSLYNFLQYNNFEINSLQIYPDLTDAS